MSAVGLVIDHYRNKRPHATADARLWGSLTAAQQALLALDSCEKLLDLLDSARKYDDEERAAVHLLDCRGAFDWSSLDKAEALKKWMGGK